VKSGIDEVILAMNATVEGQTTAHYSDGYAGAASRSPAWRMAYGRWRTRSIWMKARSTQPSRPAARLIHALVSTGVSSTFSIRSADQ